MDEKIVIPAAPPASSLECVRSLGRTGMGTIVAGSRMLAPDRVSKYTSNWYNVTPPTENILDYKSDLIGILQQEEPITIFPLREPDIYILSKFKTEFSEYVETPWVDFDTLRTTQDRKKLLNRAENLEIPTPNWRIATDWSFETDSVLKPRYSIQIKDKKQHYAGVEFIEKTEDITDLDLVDEFGHYPLAQEYISGPEFGFFALADRGDIKASFQHHRLRSHSFTGGASTYRESVKIDELENYGSRLIENLEWTGSIMVEFKKDIKDEKYKLMEINPRFWGSLPLAVRAGVDFPVLYSNMAKGNSGNFKTDYSTGIACQRVLDDFGYLVSILSEEVPNFIERPKLFPSILEILKTTPSSEFDYFSKDDPKPALLYTVETALKFLK